jgi:prepilin-type N-terminal cleavage/methylation domain-containing protein
VLLYNKKMKISKAVRSTGFTLIELLVVISIIGLLSSVVLTSLASVRVRARQAVRMQDLRNINNAIQAFYQMNGYYPGSCGWNGFYSAFGGSGWNGSTPREYVRGGSPSVCQGASNQGPYTNWIPELVSRGCFQLCRESRSEKLPEIRSSIYTTQMAIRVIS